MVGQVYGNYRIIELLAEGGMGAVYRAEHQLIGKPAAIKLLLPELSTKREIVQRFFNEARATTAIHHPGIVEIFDFGYADDGRAYIVMEFLNGVTLKERLQQRGRLDPSSAAIIARRVASAVGAAHAQGVVHRDLKPDNIFLVPDPDMPSGERAKVLDFGIAKLTDGEPGGAMLTRTGAVMGTPTYMSPEQCRGTGRVDHRTDIYALGCILFEMVTGRPPFVAEGVGELIAYHLTTPAPTSRSIDPSILPELDSLIASLLAKDPNHRIQTMNEIKASLAALPGLNVAGSTRPSTVEPFAHAGHSRHDAPTTLSSAASHSVSAPTGVGSTKGSGKRWAAIGAALVLAAGIGVAVTMSGAGDSDKKESAASGVTEPDKGTADKPPAEPEKVTITLNIQPTTAVVTVDGNVVADRPIRLDKSDTSHALVIKAPGYSDRTMKIVPKSDSSHDVVLAKVPAAKKPAVAVKTSPVVVAKKPATKATSTKKKRPRKKKRKKKKKKATGPLEVEL